MATTRAVWGVDVGRCALKALKLKAAPDGKIEVTACDYIEHAKILSQPDADRAELIGAALEKFLSRNDLSKDPVVVSVPGQHTLARFTKLPPVAPKRIPDIVRYEADQQIPFDMDEVIWDYQTFQQEGMPDIEVGIFAMKRELIREHLLYFEQSSIEPIAVQSGPLAVYNAALHDGLLGGETTILLDIGAENTDLVIATPHSLWTRTVPIGGNAFTEALVKSFKLSFSKAEELKRHAATSKYARQIFTAMRPTFADLVQELQRSIGFYSSSHRDASVEKVVGVGNAFLLPGLQKYLQQNLGLEVELPTSFKNASLTLTSGQDVLKEQFLGFFASYGLALQGLDVTKVTSNLLPTEIAKQTIWRKKRPAFAAAAAFLIVAGGLVWFRKVSDMRALAAGGSGAPPATMKVEDAIRVIESGPPASESDRMKAQYVLAAGNALKKELTTLTAQGGAERQETERVIEVMRHKTLVPQIFDVVHQSLPRPDGDLGTASQAGKFRAALGDGANPRGSRKQLFIDKMESHFEPNMKNWDWTSTVELPPPVHEEEWKAPSDLPGMMMKLTLRTPHKDGAVFIKDEFVKSLLDKGRKPGRGFYIDRVSIIRGNKFEPGRTGAAGGKSGKAAGGPKPTGSSASSEALDPVTDESMLDDWEFELWVAAVFKDFDGPVEEAEAGGDKEKGS